MMRLRQTFQLEGIQVPFVGIGTIARRVGLSREVVRYHLQRGHAPEPSRRSPSGARLFSPAEADAVVEALEERGARQ